MPPADVNTGGRVQRLFGTGHLVTGSFCAAGLLAMYLFRTTLSVIDPDLWHELSLAREVWRLGYVPWDNFFAYTPTKYPCVHHEWGAGIIAFIFTQLAGSAGIVILRYCLTVGLAAACWQSARKAGATFAVLSFLAPVAILMGDFGFSPVRAQMYSFLFAALLLGWLREDQQGSRRWLIPWLVLFVVWVNVHAGFLVGAGFFALEWFERVWRKLPHRHLLIAGLLMIPLIGLNPYGWRYISYLIHAVTLSRPLVSEWGLIWKDALHHQVFYLASLFILAYAVRGRRLPHDLGLPIVCVAALEAALHQRMLPIYAIAWIIHVPAWITRTELGKQMELIWVNRRRALQLFWATAAVVFGTLWLQNAPWNVHVPDRAVGDRNQGVVYPVGPVAYLQTVGRRTNLMTPFDQGAYVSWKLFPQVHVSLDSRYEVAYPVEQANANWRFYMAKSGWESELRRYQTDAVLVPRFLPVARAMENHANWKRVYVDDTFSLYVPSASQWPVVNREEVELHGTFP